MLGDRLLDALPLWGLFVATLMLVLLSVEGGYRLGRYRHKAPEKEKEAPVGAMVGATLGLLAFLLAFTFGLAATRFDAKRQVLLEEANAIGTRARTRLLRIIFSLVILLLGVEMIYNGLTGKL